MNDKRSFFPLFLTNFFGVLNDNFLKTLAGFIVIGWIPDERIQSVAMGCTAGALVLPYIFFSPLADALLLRHSKRQIVRIAKWAELPIMLVAVIGFLCHSVAIVIFSVLLMGVQSSLYSPAKYALVRDIGGMSRVSTGMGGMDGLSFLGVLLGTVLAAFVVDRAPAWMQYACLWLFAFAGLAFSYTIRAKEEIPTERRSVNPFVFLKSVHSIVSRYRGLHAVIYTLSIFWWTGSMLQIGLLIYGKQVLQLDSFHTGLMLALAAVGIVAGNLAAGAIADKHFLIGGTLLSGGISSALLLVLYFCPLSLTAFHVVLVLLAFLLGVFKLPLDAEVQKRVAGPTLNCVLAYLNQVSFLFILAASIVFSLVSIAFGPRAFLLLLGIVLAITSVWFTFNYRSVLCFVGRWIFRRRYDVRVDGLETLETGKTYLVLPNHPAIVDPMLVCAELYRTPLRPLSDELFFNRGGISRKVLTVLDSVLVPDLRKHATAGRAKVARALNSIVTSALAEGMPVIFYPSGHIWTNGQEEIGTRQLAYNVCRELPPDVEVIGVCTTGLWGSIWSRAGRDSSPPFGPTLAKSVLLWFCCLITRRKRHVTMHLENLTSRVKEWCTLTRLEFNKNLEAWYRTAATEAAMPPLN
ncbi:MAG: MFS transporter [Kiritimatiellae bacterium]|nr:MFS transporter [Kiritimatiellia bacterium]